MRERPARERLQLCALTHIETDEVLRQPRDLLEVRQAPEKKVRQFGVRAEVERGVTARLWCIDLSDDGKRDRPARGLIGTWRRRAAPGGGCQQAPCFGTAVTRHVTTHNTTSKSLSRARSVLAGSA